MLTHRCVGVMLVTSEVLLAHPPFRCDQVVDHHSDCLRQASAYHDAYIMNVFVLAAAVALMVDSLPSALAQNGAKLTDPAGACL